MNLHFQSLFLHGYDEVKIDPVPERGLRITFKDSKTGSDFQIMSFGCKYVILEEPNGGIVQSFEYSDLNQNSGDN